jgi:hypothetical protein
MKNTYIRKCISIVVILLFIGIAFAPYINASVVKDDLVEFNVEFCGLDKKHTVKLTQQEADEVESEEIFKEAVVELDKYDLLGGLSVKETLLLATDGHQNTKAVNHLVKIYDRNKELFDENTNMFCLVSGETTETSFLPTIGVLPAIPLGLIIAFPILILAFAVLGIGNLFSLLAHIIDNPLVRDKLVDIMNELFMLYFELFASSFIIPVLLFLIMWLIIPAKLLNSVILGGYGDYPSPNYKPANGWIQTFGLCGKKSWDGSFYGQLFGIPSPIKFMNYVGIFGFNGIRIHQESRKMYLGSALFVDINYERPQL